MRKSCVKLGDSKTNNQGIKMTITKWYDCDHLVVTFDDGCIREITSSGNRRWAKGNIRSYNFPTVYNKGYLGGDYYNNAKDRFVYKTWNHMLERCYTDKYHKLFPTYINCSVCDEWLNFQNFARWYYDNLWLELENSRLDKDILFKHNKIYSPNTCCIVDNRINVLFTKGDKNRGNFPIGVSEDCRTHDVRAYLYKENGKRTVRYVSKSNDRKQDILTAFNWYKINKEAYIAIIADEYKRKYPQFPQKLYNAMYAYEVEITD